VEGKGGKKEKKKRGGGGLGKGRDTKKGGGGKEKGKGMHRTCTSSNSYAGRQNKEGKKKKRGKN